MAEKQSQDEEFSIYDIIPNYLKDPLMISSLLVQSLFIIQAIIGITFWLKKKQELKKQKLINKDTKRRIKIARRFDTNLIE